MFQPGIFPRSVLSRLENTKFVFDQGSAPGPVGGVHDIPPPMPISRLGDFPLPSRLRGVDGGSPSPFVTTLDGFGVSVHRLPIPQQFSPWLTSFSVDLGMLWNTESVYFDNYMALESIQFNEW